MNNLIESNSILEKIPYKLSQTFSELKATLKFVKSLDEVKMYEVTTHTQVSIFCLHAIKTTLYFHNNKLIGAYYLLSKNFSELLETITQIEIILKFKLNKINKIKYQWNIYNETFFLEINKNQFLYIYQYYK